MTPRRFGTSGMASAPSLLRISFSSNAAPDSVRGLEPVAMITLRAESVSPLTAISQPSGPALTKLPRPWKKATLFFLKR